MAATSDGMGMMIRLVAVLLPLIAMAQTSACAATAEPSGPSEPPKFPDMSRYTPVNPQDYERQIDNPGRPEKMVGYYFNTPDGVWCTFSQFPLAACTGNNLPGIPPAKCDPAKRIYAINTISTDRGLSKTSGSSCNNDSSEKSKSWTRVLPPFHTLTVYGVTCGVDDRKTTACKDPQGRGFVLSPSWSGWLPHV